MPHYALNQADCRHTMWRTSSFGIKRLFHEAFDALDPTRSEEFSACNSHACEASRDSPVSARPVHPCTVLLFFRRTASTSLLLRELNNAFPLIPFPIFLHA